MKQQEEGHQPAKKRKVKHEPVEKIQQQSIENVPEKIQQRTIEKEPLKLTAKKFVGKLESREAKRKVGSEQIIVIHEKKMRKVKVQPSYKE